MRIRILKNRIALIITIAINVAILLAVVFLMNYVKGMLYKDVELNLKEVVIQNQVVVNTKLQLELNNVQIASKLIASYIENDSFSFSEALKKYCRNTGDSNYYIADLKGMAYFYEQEDVDIGFREYYILAKNGSTNIRMINSRHDGNVVFVMSVPLMLNGEMKGTAHKFYTTESMNEICALSLFSSKGFMHIINKEGDIIVQSGNFKDDSEDNRFYRILYSNENSKEAEQLKKDIEQSKSNSMRVNFSKDEYYCAYTPIVGAHDWYLISSISVDEMSSNANKVVTMFYSILIIIVAIAGTSVVLFLVYKAKQQGAMDNIAFVDSVTGGKTYARFLVEYEGLSEQKQNNDCSLVLVDIDNFKYVNSYFGYKYGDKVLKQIYDHITAKLNKSETCARISSDHFIILLQGECGARLPEMLSVPFDLNKEIYISAGVYKITDPNENVYIMVDKARTASKAVKELSSGKIAYYSQEKYNEIAHNEQIKREIGAALENGEIVPFYQPKVDIDTGELVGAEALARWIKNDGQMIMPSEFIPMCEVTGQIVDVDMAVFEQVLQFLAGNIKNGIECVPISVNFSRVHLKSANFIDNIMNGIEKYNVPCSLIQVEITESIVFEDQKAIIEFVNRLHNHGLLICIDDFGAGYSSLHMLKDIPIDVLKIDKTFLDETVNAERQSLILQVIAQMAKLLSMKVVIEGVETEDNVKLMKKIGYNIAQGYYFAKPIRKDDFEKIYRKGSL